jgi:hypothetical protein
VLPALKLHSFSCRVLFSLQAAQEGKLKSVYVKVSLGLAVSFIITIVSGNEDPDCPPSKLNSFLQLQYKNAVMVSMSSVDVACLFISTKKRMEMKSYGNNQNPAPIFLFVCMDKKSELTDEYRSSFQRKVFTGIPVFIFQEPYIGACRLLVTVNSAIPFYSPVVGFKNELPVAVVHFKF